MAAISVNVHIKIIVMRYFGNRRPRGFHYTYRFSNERRDLLDNLRHGVPPEELAAQSLGEESAVRRPRRRMAVPPLAQWVAVAGLLLLLAAALLAAF